MVYVEQKCIYFFSMYCMWILFQLSMKAWNFSCTKQCNTPSNANVNTTSNISNKTVLTTFFYFINFNIITVQVRYITIETQEVALNGYNRFLFWHLYSDEGLDATHLCLHLSTHAEKETCILYMQVH